MLASRRADSTGKRSDVANHRAGIIINGEILLLPA